MRHTAESGADGVQREAVLSDGELIERLRTRAADCRQNSMTARLTAVLDLVELLLGRKYSRSQVLEILAVAGWHFTADSFDSALRRVRKRRVNADMGASAIAPQAAAVVSQSGGVDSPSTQQSCQSDQVSPVTVVKNGSGENRLSGITDVFLAQHRHNGGSRWK